MMKKNIKVYQWLVAFLCTAVCIFLAFRQIDWALFLRHIREVRWWLLIPVFLMLFATHFCRSLRFNTMLKPIKKIGIREHFLVNSVGFLSIFLLPFRLGELTRPLLLKRRHSVSLSSGIAMVVLERVLDGLVATMFLFVGFRYLAKTQFDLLPSWIDPERLVWFSLLIFLPPLLVLVLAVTQRSWASLVVKYFASKLTKSMEDKINDLFHKFMDGLSSLPGACSLLLLLFQSIGVWLAAMLSYHFMLGAFGMNIHWSASFVLVGFSALGLMLPGPPGFVGTFQYAIQLALLIYGVSRTLGLAYGTVIYLCNVFYIVSVGLACVYKLSYKVTEVLDEIQTHEQTP